VKEQATRFGLQHERPYRVANRRRIGSARSGNAGWKRSRVSARKNGLPHGASSRCTSARVLQPRPHELSRSQHAHQAAILVNNHHVERFCFARDFHYACGSGVLSDLCVMAFDNDARLTTMAKSRDPRRRSW
jgi:hypothetical protein